MKEIRGKGFLFNPVFFSGLLTLFLNDRLLKYLFPGWLTGKLSDFAGLLIFPLFIAFIIPAFRYRAAIITGLIFCFWKLPIADGLINWFNSFSILPVARTIDYSDFICLIVLPVSHHLINKYEHQKANLSFSVHPAAIIIPASLIFMSTSLPYYRSDPNGDVYLGKTFRLKMSPDELLQKLTDEGFSVRKDTSGYAKENYTRIYIIENWKPEFTDTIPAIRFTLYENEKKGKTEITIDNITLKGEHKIIDWRELKRISKRYEQLLKKEMIKELK